MTFYVVLGVAIVLAVLIMTLVAISKGYAYQHSIDPLPDDVQNDLEEEDRTD
ncbi:YtzI protein [Virgibacillus siamensis]|uniref:YtzI protein n=1 Tax=Virgibacillus siamensis TaxID=480071 RepID=UPI000985977B|nr:YtzI protein [Virgibacillus siamensis]